MPATRRLTRSVRGGARQSGPVVGRRDGRRRIPPLFRRANCLAISAGAGKKARAGVVRLTTRAARSQMRLILHLLSPRSQSIYREFVIMKLADRPQQLTDLNLDAQFKLMVRARPFFPRRAPSLAHALTFAL